MPGDLKMETYGEMQEDTASFGFYVCRNCGYLHT